MAVECVAGGALRAEGGRHLGHAWLPGYSPSFSRTFPGQPDLPPSVRSIHVPVTYARICNTDKLAAITVQNFDDDHQRRPCKGAWRLEGQQRARASSIYM